LDATEKFLENIQLENSEKIAQKMGYITSASLVYGVYSKFRHNEELKEKYSENEVLALLKGLAMPGIVDIAIQSKFKKVPGVVWALGIALMPLDFLPIYSSSTHAVERLFPKGLLAEAGSNEVRGLESNYLTKEMLEEIENKIASASERKLDEIAKRVEMWLDKKELQGENIEETMARSREIWKKGIRFNGKILTRLLLNKENRMLRESYLLTIYALKAFGFSKEGAHILTNMLMRYEGLGGFLHSYRVALLSGGANPTKYVRALLHDIGKQNIAATVHFGAEEHIFNNIGQVVNRGTLTASTKMGHIEWGLAILEDSKLLKKLGLSEEDISLLEKLDVRGGIEGHHIHYIRRAKGIKEGGKPNPRDVAYTIG
ncbi:MAG: hypothetical protein D6797_06285, partial [Bdellovibrio sp.]